VIVFKEVKIKYEHLDAMLKEHLQDIRLSSSVNVIIDLKEMFRKIFRPGTLPDSPDIPMLVEELASDVINTIAHYRNYLYKKGKYSSFYILYSKAECDLMKAKESNYKREYYDKYFHNKDADKEVGYKIEASKKVVEVLEKIVNNIPNSMFIETSKFDEFTVARFLVEKTNKNELNIILSNDELFMQLLNEHTVIINMKSVSSDLITTDNAMKVLLGKDTTVSLNLLPLVASLTGTERYSLPNVNRFGPHKAFKLVERLLSENKILNQSYVDFPLKREYFTNLDKTEQSLLEAFDQVNKNYSVIINNDIYYSKQPELTILFNKAKSKYNWNYFLELNAKVFSRYPLNLDMLVKGESL
jgi:hypothetical protein